MLVERECVARLVAAGGTAAVSVNTYIHKRNKCAETPPSLNRMLTQKGGAIVDFLRAWREVKRFAAGGRVLSDAALATGLALPAGAACSADGVLSSAAGSRLALRMLTARQPF